MTTALKPFSESAVFGIVSLGGGITVGVVLASNMVANRESKGTGRLKIALAPASQRA